MDSQSSRRLRALQAGIKAALVFGDKALAARMTTLHDAAAKELSGAADLQEPSGPTEPRNS